MLRGFRRNKEEFFASIAAGDVERAQIVLAGGEINVDCKTLEDATPFMRACYNGDLPMAKLLAKHGASVHYQSAITGETALHSACCGPSDDLFKVVEWLVTEMGVAVSVADRNGKTPLDLARMLDLPAVAKLLKEDAYDIRGKTPLDNRPPPLSPAEIEESGSYAVNGRNGYLPSERKLPFATTMPVPGEMLLTWIGRSFYLTYLQFTLKLTAYQVESPAWSSRTKLGLQWRRVLFLSGEFQVFYQKTITFMTRLWQRLEWCEHY
jgi:hypothetical protein